MVIHVAPERFFPSPSRCCATGPSLSRRERGYSSNPSPFGRGRRRAAPEGEGPHSPRAMNDRAAEVLPSRLDPLQQHALVHELAHAAGHAVARQRLEIEAVDARILVFVEDLPAAFLGADAERLRLLLALRGE